MAKRKNPAAVELGRRGGLKGGRAGAAARNRNLTPEQRSELAKRAALARWEKKTAEPKEQQSFLSRWEAVIKDIPLKRRAKSNAGTEKHLSGSADSTS